ncbi:GNAT family N-acetyltransferase [Paenibacillus caseinilyticus]|uniref:Spermidine acetyltransferase n=1 Tax=Paenibacillus mucilaginosus K02 TaxID=997761 RepID=I0BK56_9BACL|nr:GNAT family N-acetyltransferase [Paenibacillus mucilaginosus]AFH62753.1 spermidine acetyltransferase [Paenibacillus mucilaginosus K02]
MDLELMPVSIENWFDCTKLKVKQEQVNVFPAPVVNWIAESKYVDDFELRAIYRGDSLVGFLVFCNKPDGDGNHWIPAVMIDQNHQGKGYGRTAMKKLIELMKSMGCKRLMIGHRPHNLIAGGLYESLGFKKVSEQIINGEVIHSAVGQTTSCFFVTKRKLVRVS